MPSVMQVLDVLCSPWAIQPDKLLELRAIYLAHARGEGVDLAAVEAKLGRKLENTPKRYTVVDGVAVLPLDGVLAKRMNLFMHVSGGTSTQLAARDLRQALDDPEVQSIVLAIDSPGGTVDGTQTLADMVRSAANEKPIVSWASGTMASAAYWIGSAGLQVYAADRTTQVGSIGVVATHVDVSAAEAQKGVRTTEITAGKYKRVASAYAPLSEEGRKTLQDQVDYTYSVFVDAVAQNRGASVEQVLERMADGRVFLGDQAVEAGLVDGIATLDEVIAGMKKHRRSATASASITSTGASTMTITREQVAAEAPDLITALQAEGAAAERARIQAVEEQSLAGHEALIAGLKFDGKTSGPEAAAQVLAAERKSRATAASALAADAPAPLPVASVPAFESQAGEDTSLPVEDRCKAKWEASAEIRKEFSSLKAFTAYVSASERGVARIMSKSKQGA